MRPFLHLKNRMEDFGTKLSICMTTNPFSSLTHLKVFQYFEGFIEHQWNTDLLRVWCVAVDHDVNVYRQIFPVSRNRKCTLDL